MAGKFRPGQIKKEKFVEFGKTFGKAVMSKCE
jgi:hypothetical protein